MDLSGWFLRPSIHPSIYWSRRHWLWGSMDGLCGSSDEIYYQSVFRSVVAAGQCRCDTQASVWRCGQFGGGDSMEVPIKIVLWAICLCSASRKLRKIEFRCISMPISLKGHKPRNATLAKARTLGMVRYALNWTFSMLSKFGKLIFF